MLLVPAGLPCCIVCAGGSSGMLYDLSLIPDVNTNDSVVSVNLSFKTIMIRSQISSKAVDGGLSLRWDLLRY